jgi:hypothetical protein
VGAFHYMKSSLNKRNVLKGSCHNIFVWLFHQTTPPGPPDTRVIAFLHMASYSRRYSTMKLIFLVVSGVNDTADHKSDP